MKMASNLRTQRVINILMMKADLEPEPASDEEESDDSEEESEES
jgi:hypothetical protein